jgi:hypothetical protein
VATTAGVAVAATTAGTEAATNTTKETSGGD